MAARSFSSPQGELEMHRLRRALERVSFDQTLGGRLDESDGETKPPSGGTLSRRSLTDSSKMLSKTEKNRIMLHILLPSNLYCSLCPSDPQMDSCSPPLLWTGTASQIRSTSSLQFTWRILLQVSAARSFTACSVAGLCPGRSVLTWGTSGTLRARRHQKELREVEEEERKKEEWKIHGRRSFTS